MTGIVSSSKYSVGIIGAGPTGLFMSHILNNYGIDHCIIEKKKISTPHPQAHFINFRSMELLRCQLPSLFCSVVERTPPSYYWRDFVYCHSIVGRSYEREDHFIAKNNKKSILEASPSSFVHLPQNVFETLLRTKVSPSQKCYVDDFFGYEVTDLKNNPEKSTIIAKSSSQLIHFDCQYIIAADGANSSIRRSLDIPLEGTKALQTLINVHFKCAKLYGNLSPRPAMLYFVFNQKMIGVFVAHDPLRNEWVCQIPIFPPYQSIEDYCENDIKEIIIAGIDSNPSSKNAYNQTDIQILSVKTWTMNAEVSSKYNNQSCNIFLVGDAAHRFPPAGGFGMNTGLQDVHNLAWKLAYVIGGHAHKNLLKSYEIERKAIAEANTVLSLHNYEKSVTAARNLGVDPTLAKLAVETASSSLATRMLPQAVRKFAVQNTLKIGLSSLSWLGIDGHPLGEFRVNALKKLVSEGRSLPLIFPKEDLDFEYTNGAFVRNSRNDELPFSLRVGARAPHCWFTIHRLPPYEVIIDDRSINTDVVTKK